MIAAKTYLHVALRLLAPRDNGAPARSGMTVDLIRRSVCRTVRRRRVRGSQSGHGERGVAAGRGSYAEVKLHIKRCPLNDGRQGTHDAPGVAFSMTSTYRVI